MGLCATPTLIALWCPMIVAVFELSDRSFLKPSGDVNGDVALIQRARATGLVEVVENTFTFTDAGKQMLIQHFKNKGAKDFADAVLLACQEEYIVGPVLQIHVTNPKRPDSAAWRAFNCYMVGMSQEEIIEAMGMMEISRSVALKNINWDKSHGFISFS